MLKSLSESFANQATIQPDASVNKVNAALFDPLTNQSESIESSSAPDPFAGVGPSEQSSSYPPQPKQQPPQQLNVYPSSASQYNMSQNQEPKMSYPNNQSSQSMPMPSQPSYQQNVPQQQQQQSQQQQQQQQQQYPQASQPYQPQQQQQPTQPQQQMQNTQNSYASQGQQLNTYPGYPTSDPNQYGGQGAGNPYRTMSPSQGRYPQPMQGYDYRSNPVAAQQISSAPNSLGYPGPGFK